MTCYARLVSGDSIGSSERLEDCKESQGLEGELVKPAAGLSRGTNFTSLPWVLEDLQKKRHRGEEIKKT